MTESIKNPSFQNTNDNGIDPSIDSEDAGIRHRFNETPSQAVSVTGFGSGKEPENAKNPKEGSDFLGGPQNGTETPRHEKKAPKGSLGESQKQARNPQTEDETPGNGGNGGNGGNRNATSVGSASTPGRRRGH
jgi:hypothetical protein